MTEKKVLLKAVDLKQYFPVGKKKFCKANDGITVDIYEDEIFGLVGESGCGKSTFGRTLLQLNKQTSGKAIYYGRTLDEVAPQYVGKTLDNYKKLLSEYRKFAAKVDAAEKEYDGMTDEGENKLAKLNELNMLKADLKGKYYDLASVVGGFITVEDNAEALKLFKEEHLICRKIRAMYESILIAQAAYEDAEYALRTARDENKATAHLEAKCNAAKEKVSRLSEKRDEYQKQLAEKRAEIKVFKQPYLQDDAFAEAEKYVDEGIDLSRLEYNEMRLLRSDLQMIFQDPYSSLNPRMTVGNIISSGMKTHHLFIKENARMQEAVLKVMEQCGLQPYFLHRFPHQFSGGQRQRIGIARSLAVKPKLVVCDEAVSALDVSIQSQIINLLQDLKADANLTYLFITHDLSVVKYISDRIGVMYLGNMVELAPSQEIFSNPMHPYTKALIAAIPTVESRGTELHILEGDIPSPVNPPKGCKFHTRCDYCTEICEHVVPAWEQVGPDHYAACHHMHEIKAQQDEQQ